MNRRLFSIFYYENLPTYRKVERTVYGMHIYQLLNILTINHISFTLSRLFFLKHVKICCRHGISPHLHALARVSKELRHSHIYVHKHHPHFKYHLLEKFSVVSLKFYKQISKPIKSSKSKEMFQWQSFSFL